MYLSKLRIFGFKSFANKVEVNFPGEGITSVVVGLTIVGIEDRAIVITGDRVCIFLKVE